MNQGAEPTGRREAPAPGGGLSALRESPEFRGPIEPLEDHDHSNDHLASLYDTRDEQFDAVVPFIREGLERGERCLYVADQNSREAVLAAMRDRGADVDADGLPRVWGDESQLHQLFQNLLRNAIEYSGDEPPRVRISAEREGGRWVISVSDDGVGIDPDDADRLFEMFQRLHGREEHEGAGIGLALCERIVERHGGDIRVDSTPGEGSTFSLPDYRPDSSLE